MIHTYIYIYIYIYILCGCDRRGSSAPGKPPPLIRREALTARCMNLLSLLVLSLLSL